MRLIVEPGIVRGHRDPVLAQKLAAAVQAYRVERGLSVQAIADDAEMSQQALDRFLKRAADPKYTVESSTLEKLAKAIHHDWKLEPATPTAATPPRPRTP